MKRILIQNGHVLSMDPRVGDFPSADVLIENDIIVQVAPGIEATDAEVIDAKGHSVMPGLVDTHRHSWQAQMRGSSSDITLFGYLCGVRFNAIREYLPEDVRLGTHLGALEALNGGATTILDYAHCVNTPDHADAAYEGVKSAGLRALFCYGFYECSPEAPLYFPNADARINDFHRFADTYFSSNGGLLTLGAGLSEVGLVPFSTTRKEIAAARERGARIVTHSGGAWSVPNGIAELDAFGLLGPEQVHVHCNALHEEEWEALAKAGAKVSISVEAELNSGLGRPPFAQCKRHGIKPTLSCDSPALVRGDLLTQARFGLAFKRWEETEALNLARQDPMTVTAEAREALEWCTMNGAEAVGLEDKIGSLTPGKQADIIIIGGPSIAQHPRRYTAGSVVFQTNPEDVRTILVAGRVVKKDGKLIGVDLPALLDQVERSAAGIMERADAAAASAPPQNIVSDGFTGFRKLMEANLARV